MIKKNLYEVIIDDILQTIKNNQFSFEKPICTEKSLSEQYGVSRITAKRALMELERDGVLYRKRGSGSFVCRDILTRQGEIQKAAPPASVDKSAKKVVAFVLPFDITRGGVMEIIRAASDCLSENGYYLSLHISDRNLKKEKTIIEQLFRQDVSGIIYYPTNNSFHVDELMMFVLEDKPVVILDLLHDCNFIYSVVSDNINGQRELTQRVIDQGHRRIAYVFNVPIDKVPSIRDRFYGYCSALKDNGIALDWNLVNNKAPEEPEALKVVVGDLIKQGATAILTENDEVAFRVLQACNSLGVSVPQDISLAGFDDSRFATTYGADLTSVRQDFHTMGELAAKIIISDLARHHSYEYRQILPVQLVERGSTRALGSTVPTE